MRNDEQSEVKEIDKVQRDNIDGNVEYFDEIESLPPPPDGGWGWMVVFASFIIHVIADGITYTFGIYYVEFLDYFHQSNAKTSWILSILSGVTLSIGPISSALTNRYGCRGVTIVGTLIAAVGLICSIFAPSVEVLYLTIGIMTGCGFGFMYLPAIVSVSMYFEKKRAFATGIAVCGSGVGTFTMAPVLQYLVDIFGWKGAILVTAGIVLHCLIFGLFFRPLEWGRKRRDNDYNRNHQNCDDESALRKNGSPSPNGSGVITNGDLKKHVINKNLELIKRESLTPADQNYLKINGIVKDNRHHSLDSDSSFFLSANSLACRHQNHSHENHPGPLHRKDVLYGGSLLSLPQYRSSRSLYATSSVSIPKYASTANEWRLLKLFHCSDEMSFAFHEMLDLSIMKDPIYILFNISNFLTSIGFNVPFVYTKDRAIHHGINEDNASFLLSMIGISNMIGRIVVGYVSDKPCVNRLYLYNCMLTVCGISTIFSFICTDYISMGIYASIFGITAGAYVGLTSVILTDLFGLEKLTNGFGILLLFQGAASFIGPPIAGWLYDVTGSYDAGYQVVGVSITISGLMLFVIPAIQKYQTKKRNLPEMSKTIKPNIICTDAEDKTTEVDVVTIV
ncbi:Mct1 (predicted) [Pycnogonum litorale]